MDVVAFVRGGVGEEEINNYSFYPFTLFIY